MGRTVTIANEEARALKGTHPAEKPEGFLPGVALWPFTFHCKCCACVFAMHLDCDRAEQLRRDTTPIGRDSAAGPICCPLCGEDSDLRVGLETDDKGR